MAASYADELKDQFRLSPIEIAKKLKIQCDLFLKSDFFLQKNFFFLTLNLLNDYNPSGLIQINGLADQKKT